MTRYIEELRTDLLKQIPVKEFRLPNNTISAQGTRAILDSIVNKIDLKIVASHYGVSLSTVRRLSKLSPENAQAEIARKEEMASFADVEKAVYETKSLSPEEIREFLKITEVIDGKTKDRHTITLEACKTAINEHLKELPLEKRVEIETLLGVDMPKQIGIPQQEPVARLTDVGNGVLHNIEKAPFASLFVPEIGKGGGAEQSPKGEEKHKATPSCLARIKEFFLKMLVAITTEGKEKEEQNPELQEIATRLQEKKANLSVEDSPDAVTKVNDELLAKALLARKEKQKGKKPDAKPYKTPEGYRRVLPQPQTGESPVAESVVLSTPVVKGKVSSTPVAERVVSSTTPVFEELEPLNKLETSFLLPVENNTTIEHAHRTYLNGVAVRIKAKAGMNKVSPEKMLCHLIENLNELAEDSVVELSELLSEFQLFNTVSKFASLNEEMQTNLKVAIVTLATRSFKKPTNKVEIAVVEGIQKNLDVISKNNPSLAEACGVLESAVNNTSTKQGWKLFSGNSATAAEQSPKKRGSFESFHLLPEGAKEMLATAVAGVFDFFAGKRAL